MTAGDETPTSVGIVGVGVVGRRCARLLDGRHRLMLHDRRDEAAQAAAGVLRDARVVADVADLASCATVVLAHPGEHVDVADQLLRLGVHVVSLAGSVGRVQALLDLDDVARQHGTGIVVGAAMSPGLSGLLARWLASELATCDEIHVATHGTAGPSCAREHHRALGSSATGWHDGTWIERRGGSGRELCWFPEPVGAYDCYRADLAEPRTLHRALPDVTRISARASATRRDRFTSWLPMLTPPHREGRVGALRVEARGARADGGRATLIAGIAERVGTASGATAAAFADAAARGRLPRGAVVAGDAALPTVELLQSVAEGGVRMQRFTGVPESLARQEDRDAPPADRPPPTGSPAPRATRRP